MEPGPDELKNESARKKTESPLHASVLGHLISLEGPVSVTVLMVSQLLAP